MTAIRPGIREVGALLAILVLAALLRLGSLDQRGAWDADQGHDMLVLQALVERGEVPLLGPRTSVGTFHHGAVYYYLLAPAAFLSGADPVAVTAELALIGIGAVAATWWLARLLGGPVAAAAAALLAAVSPAGIEESTFIWNPNPIPLAAAVAFASALQALRSGNARWWVLAAVGAMVTMQSHILGIVALPPLAIAWFVDLRRRRADAEPVTPLFRAGAAGLAIIALGYLPLAAHELLNGFSETRAILAYIGGDGASAAIGVLTRILLVGMRSIAWPMAGVVTERALASLIVLLIVIALGAIAIIAGDRPERRAATWVAGTIGWSILALAVFAPSLAVITPGLPNDHYHSFLDPLVLAVVGAGLARLASGAFRIVPLEQATAGDPESVQRARWGLAGGTGAVLALIAVTAWPPTVSPDGGWRLADDTADRIVLATGTGPLVVHGIPPFKSADALQFPLEQHGAIVVPETALETPGSATVAIVVCDPLFAEVVGAACGGPAEDLWANGHRLDVGSVQRFDGGTRRVVSVYPAP